MIYVAADPNLRFTIDAVLGDLAPCFEMWHLERMHFVGTHEFRTPQNWKLAVDTFFEGYHFAVLHKQSVGDYAIGNLSAHDRFGPQQRHQRLAYPNKSILSLKEIPQERWTADIFEHFQLIHFIYPNVSLLVSPTAVEFFQFYPGASVDQCVSRYRCYWRSDPARADQGRDAQAHFKWVVQVVGDEDYRVSCTIQQTLNTGLKALSTLGRNEPALFYLHASPGSGRRSPTGNQHGL